MFVKEVSCEPGALNRLVSEAAAGDFSLGSKKILEVLREGYMGRTLELSDAEVAELCDGITEATIMLSELRQVALGCRNEAAVRESAEFVEECRSSLMQALIESTVDDQIGEWRRQVGAVMADYARLESSRKISGAKAERETIVATMLTVIGAGVALVMQATGSPFGAMVIGACAALAGMVYYVLKAYPHEYDESNAAGEMDTVKLHLRMKANRILPQLDGLERKAQGPAAKASIQSLRSQLEAVALEEIAEKNAMERRKLALAAEKNHIDRAKLLPKGIEGIRAAAAKEDDARTHQALA